MALRKLAFCGCYGMESVGDDASLIAILQMLKDRAFEFQPVVFARHPSRLFPIPSEAVVIQNLEYQSKKDAEGKFLRGFNPGEEQLLEDLLEVYESVDVAVLGAGNFFNDRSFGLFKGMLPRLFVHALAAKQAGAKVMLYGMSSSGISNPLAKRMARWLLEPSDVVTFREEHSLQLLAECGIYATAEVIPDPVLYLTPPAQQTSTHDLLVNIRDGLPEHSLAAIEVAIAGYKNVALACHYPTDREQGERVIGQSHTVYSDISPTELLTVYARSERVLSSRLHSAVFAYLAQRPFVAVGYEPKVTGFCTRIGHSWIDPEKVPSHLDFQPGCYPIPDVSRYGELLINAAS